MILLCCASELGLPEDLSAIEVILYYYYYFARSINVGTTLNRQPNSNTLPTMNQHCANQNTTACQPSHNIAPTITHHCANHVHHPILCQPSPNVLPTIRQRRTSYKPTFLQLLLANVEPTISQHCANQKSTLCQS